MATVIECDICGKTESLYLAGKITAHGHCFDEKSIDVCLSCWEKFEKWWKDFTYKKPHDVMVDVDDGWGKPDGETLATSTWGGAGPDCINEQERVLLG